MVAAPAGGIPKHTIFGGGLKEGPCCCAKPLKPHMQHLSLAQNHRFSPPVYQGVFFVTLAEAGGGQASQAVALLELADTGGFASGDAVEVYNL